MKSLKDPLTQIKFCPKMSKDIFMQDGAPAHTATRTQNDSQSISHLGERYLAKQLAAFKSHREPLVHLTIGGG